VASYSDSAASVPLGYFVDQVSWAFGTSTELDDFIILRYSLGNRSDRVMDSLYVGVFLDIDIDNYGEDTGGTDSTCNLVYVRGAGSTHAGLCLLQDDAAEPPASNITLIHNPTFVWPTMFIADEDKYAFLTAADPEHVLTDASDPDDYSVLAAAGPIHLDPGETRLIPFAILGGQSLGDLSQSAHVARMLFQGGVNAIDLLEGPTPVATCLGPVFPNPFNEASLIRYDIASPTDVSLELFDVGGRLVRRLAAGQHSPKRYSLTWDGRDENGNSVPCGIYFLKLDTGEKVEYRRLVRIR
jgi:hypothetical protein